MPLADCHHMRRRRRARTKQTKVTVGVDVDAPLMHNDTQYLISAMTLYNGFHYVTDVRELEGWLRYDGFKSAGVKHPQRSPPARQYRRQDNQWFPVLVLYTAVKPK